MILLPSSFLSAPLLSPVSSGEGQVVGLSRKVTLPLAVSAAGGVTLSVP